MKSEPLISVLICNYNYSRYIKKSLDCVLRQAYANIEVIIVDDGSTDKSVEIIKNYIEVHREYKINLIAKRQNQGLCHARNDALDYVNGDYFLFLDSDDTIPPDYISKMYETLINQEADVVYGDVKAFGGEVYTTDYPAFDRNELFKRNYINITSLVKTSALNGHRFDIALNRKTHEDYDFWLGLSLQGLKFVKAQDTYLNYRIQKVSRNANVLNMKERVAEVVDIWKYCFYKYQASYKEELTQEMVFDFYDYQLDKLGDELLALNDTVQDELVPELKRREAHIEYLAEKSIRQLLKERLKKRLRLGRSRLS